MSSRLNPMKKGSEEAAGPGSDRLTALERATSPAADRRRGAGRLMVDAGKGLLGTLANSLRPLVPVAARAWLRTSKKRLTRRPAVVRFGTLRRLTPVSVHWGLDRGLCIDRYFIEGFLGRHAGDIRGRTLEIAANDYTRRFGGERVTHSDVLHVREGNRNATIVGDLTRADHIPSETFDCIIFTQTLQYIYDAPAAVATLYRILKPGGVVLASFPMISRTDRAGSRGWVDYWRFTEAASRRLFADVFGADNVSVESHGNVLVACAFLYGLAADELSREELHYRDPNFQMLVTLRAVRAGRSG
jgi:hypothetical protein